MFSSRSLKVSIFILISMGLLEIHDLFRQCSGNNMGTFPVAVCYTKRLFVLGLAQTQSHVG